MREVIMHEERATNDGRIFAAGSIKSRAPRLPVLFQYQWDEVIGWASDFQRDEHGVISVEVTLKEGVWKDRIEEFKFEAVPELRAVKASKEYPIDLHTIVSGELVAIVYVQTGLRWKDLI